MRIWWDFRRELPKVPIAFSEAFFSLRLGRLDLEKCINMCVFLKLDVILLKTGSDHIILYHFICDNY